VRSEFSGRLVAVVDRASVGLGDGHGRRPARHGGVQGVVQIIVRDLQACRVRCGLVVDGSLVDQLAAGIDDEDVRPGARVVRAADDPGWIEHRRGRRWSAGVDDGTC
jgi:hypothetical protein